MTITLGTISGPVPRSADSKISLPGWPHYDDEEIAAVERVLRSGKVNYWTGNEGRKFEQEFAASVGSSYGVALANGTVALELALRILGVGSGDEVITTSRTFIASAICAVAIGATPVFADVDRDSQNLTAETLKAAITPRTRAIIAVHLAGWPCDMDPILDLAREYGLHVIEDCAQAHGASYKGRPVGSMGSVGAFSFCQDKILTTAGEGGMIVTKDGALFEAAWAYKDHGKSYDAVYRRKHPLGFRWLHESFGTNWRMTEPQAAVGRIQLRKLQNWVALRRRNAAILRETFDQLTALRTPAPGAESQHAYYKFYSFVRPEQLRSGWSRDRIMEVVESRGIACSHGSCSEVYLERAFPGTLRPKRRFPVARELGETSLMFQVHPTLSEENMQDIARSVTEVVSQATST
jgi:dTDP-4-amino-4,6-dideoxygalactose transaminase